MIEEQMSRGQEGKPVSSLHTLAPCGRGQGEGSKSLHKTLSRICKFAYCSLTNSTLSQRERVKSKNAFTLAEVLITLGIIGIVAAMTLPAVITNHQSSVLRESFKKSYSVMAQVTQRVFFEDFGGSYPDVIDFTKVCNKYIIKSSICIQYMSTSCDKTIFPIDSFPNAGVLQGFISKTYTNYGSNLLINDGMFALNDGTFVYFDYGDGYGKILVTIDINGWKKKPNKGGVDLFMFEILPSGTLAPVGDELPYIGNRNTNCLSNPDVTCTYEALSNPDYFKKVKK
ncbi:type II secretion system protein [bacterium]|nr:type II secretion system protein [bacterium]